MKQNMSHDGDRAGVAAVALKLPLYWPSDPQVWFAQVEAQFSTRRIAAQKTKFHHVVGSLTLEIIVEVRDLILSPPTDNPYDTVREQLVKPTLASEQKRLQLLHAHHGRVGRSQAVGYLLAYTSIYVEHNKGRK